MSSNSFWATFRPILLNFVKTLFLLKKVQPPLSFLHVHRYLTNSEKSGLQTDTRTDRNHGTQPWDALPEKDKYNHPLDPPPLLTTHRHIFSFHR